MNGKETIDQNEKRNSLNENQEMHALALMKINCEPRIGVRFADEANDSTSRFWKLIHEHYKPKTVQNQTSVLNRIFTTHLSSGTLIKNLEGIQENARLLGNLIEGSVVTPLELLDTVISMWIIINLPSEYQVTGELLLKKLEIKQKTPSTRNTIDEI